VDFVKEKIKDVIEQVKGWNWDIICKLIFAGFICWIYLSLCEWNCTRHGDYWDNKTYTCRYTPPSQWKNKK
jgi:hypothetical protein